MCEISLKLTIKTPEWHYRGRSGVIIVNFENISQLTFSVFNVDFDLVNIF